MLAKFLADSKAAVIFSGAGMSTESGLQDFRSADRGMWNNRNPAELANIEAIDSNREQFIRFYQWRIEEMGKHQPNDGHRIIAKWERRGLVRGIITQNVENYHELAGSTTMAKLHGDLGTMRCMNCSQSYPSNDYLPPVARIYCECGGFIRPNIVLFGEMLPEKALTDADRLTASADLFIVLGSSLQVSPANHFPVQAKERGAKLVIVNHDPTPLDKYADMIVRCSIGEVLRWTDQQMMVECE